MQISKCRMMLVEGPSITGAQPAVVNEVHGSGGLPCIVNLMVLPNMGSAHPLGSVHAFETRELAEAHYGAKLKDTTICYFPPRA